MKINCTTRRQSVTLYAIWATETLKLCTLLFLVLLITPVPFLVWKKVVVCNPNVLWTVSHHFFEGVLYSTNHQAFMLDLLLSKEARGWRSVARGTWCASGPTQWSSSGQGAVRAWGVSLEVVVIGLLSQHSGRQGGHVAENLNDGLELAGDVVLQQAGGNDCRAWTGVAIEQSPVLENQALAVLNAHIHNVQWFHIKQTEQRTLPLGQPHNHNKNAPDVYFIRKLRIFLHPLISLPFVVTHTYVYTRKNILCMSGNICQDTHPYDCNILSLPLWLIIVVPCFLLWCHNLVMPIFHVLT